MLEKTFESKEVEKKHYETWEKSGVFHADVKSNKAPYCIPMPPPNVTGSLHMGHALTMTLQDILSRFERMQGRDVLWQPGTDHAGIATQLVVERLLEKEGSSRHKLGRENFLKRVWEWKEQSGNTITSQLRRLGATPDWERERFTMDPDLNKGVNKVFVQLFNEKLIYKDKRLVNWDPKMHTAVSDLEVEQVEIKGNMWHFKYPIKGMADTFITIATTRPETMLGDTAVAVHPEDERYKALIGKMVVLPITGREIPIIADDYADPEKGSGAVKITPAHDFNDFEVGKRHKLPMLSILDKDAKITDGDGAKIPAAYIGLDRFVARKQVVAEIEALGLLDKIEPQVHAVPHDEKSKSVVLEPFLTDQWYCDAVTLAKPAIEAVETGKTQFIPKTWEKTYFEWMRNIQPWCISRQLWWGHQIPAWYDDNGKVFVAETEEEAQKLAGAGVKLTRDPDVLDTWFSSALWPFSTLGWPENTEEVKRYYPAETLITGFDIIFFWVARMMMMGIHFMKDVPFKKVYIHALVRDEKGQKMSKTKGNVVDPLEVIDQYGADALRFTMAALAAQGRDVKWSNSRAEGYRNFATKLWNASRFCEMNGCALKIDFKPQGNKHTLNRWIVSELAATSVKVSDALKAFRYNDAATALYQFTWGTFCDWYIEFTKPLITGSDAAVKQETQDTTGWVLDQILLLLNPFMPYLTEELHAHLLGKEKAGKEDWLQTKMWPVFDKAVIDSKAQEEVNWVIKFISEVRSNRTDLEIPAATFLKPQIHEPSRLAVERYERYKDLIERLARIENPLYEKIAPNINQTSSEEVWLREVVEDVKAWRETLGIPSTAKVSLRLANLNDVNKELYNKYKDEIKGKAGIQTFHYVEQFGTGRYQIALPDATLAVSIEEQLIVQALTSIKNKIEKVDANIERINKMLNNQGFLAKAPEEVVVEQKEARAEAETIKAKLSQALKQLEAA